ncbi:MAG: winged helix-turn-helix domain-containing protein [Rhodobacteraceae bacterium]|nr:winged helix-turn-helix domain-containing protein [Paracoccaceae bacterium]
MIYRFEDYELDLKTAELRKAGAPVAIEPQVLDLLALLAENHDRVLSKDEIVDVVWQGRAISGAAVDSRIRSVRLAVGDSGQAQRLIRTVRRRGYRFVGAVSAAPPERADETFVKAPSPQPVAAHEPTPEAFAAGVGLYARRGMPSLAVLPFQRFGEDTRFPAAALALPHDLIAALSRLRWLKVIARASSFQFHGAACDPVEAAGRLGARYVLLGAVTLTNAGVELFAELTDAMSGTLIWADQFSGRHDDMHLLRERVTA